jgi:hypothetical protein
MSFPVTALPSLTIRGSHPMRVLHRRTMSSKRAGIGLLDSSHQSCLFLPLQTFPNTTIQSNDSVLHRQHASQHNWNRMRWKKLAQDEKAMEQTSPRRHCARALLTALLRNDYGNKMSVEQQLISWLRKDRTVPGSLLNETGVDGLWNYQTGSVNAASKLGPTLAGGVSSVWFRCCHGTQWQGEA